MDREAWWATNHGVAELSMTKHLSKKKKTNNNTTKKPMQIKFLYLYLLTGERKKLIKINIFASKKMRRYDLRHSGAVNVSNI